MHIIASRAADVRGWVRADRDRATDAAVALLLLTFAVVSLWAPYPDGVHRVAAIGAALCAAGWHLARVVAAGPAAGRGGGVAAGGGAPR